MGGVILRLGTLPEPWESVLVVVTAVVQVALIVAIAAASSGSDSNSFNIWVKIHVFLPREYEKFERQNLHHDTV